jgi:hypothetical protein
MMNMYEEGDSRVQHQREQQALRRLILYVFLLIFVSSVLLAINTGLIYSLTQGIEPMLPEWIGIHQLIQLAIFVGPLGLLYLEWYFWDIVSSRKIRAR